MNPKLKDAIVHAASCTVPDLLHKEKVEPIKTMLAAEETVVKVVKAFMAEAIRSGQLIEFAEKWVTEHVVEVDHERD